MYFNSNCAINNTLFSIKLGDDVVLNLPIVFHQVFLS